MSNIKSILRSIWYYRSEMILVLAPLLFSLLPILADDDFKQQAKCAFVLLWMAVYWSTEVIPLPVTSFFPIVLFPLLGILESKKVLPLYFKDLSGLFIGGLMVAVAVEHWNLHKRLALRFLLFVGSKPHWMMLGFMIPTWFLSMWISNTATTAMMVPIAQAVIDELNGTGAAEDDVSFEMAMTTEGETTAASMDANNANANDNTNPQKSLLLENRSYDNSKVLPEYHDEPEVGDGNTRKTRVPPSVAKGMNLCICYAATVGGISTLTGTGPNLLMKAAADKEFEKYGMQSKITFGSWMLFAIPVSLICLVIAWLWLQLFFTGIRTFCRKEDKDDAAKIRSMLEREYRKLGPVSYAEISVMILFLTLALLWLFRSPGMFPGWGDLFDYGDGKKYVSDTTASIFVAIMLFVVPARLPRIFRNDPDDREPSKPLLDWKTASTKLPWGIVLLIGGGMAMAAAVGDSGLSDWIAEGLQSMIQGLQREVMIALLCILVATTTEFTSNTATASLLMPILVSIAKGLWINPLYLLYPAILSCSFAFMLPVATPPNAIVFAYGHVRVIDMLKAGFGMNIICVLVVTLATATWGAAMFDINRVPWPVANGTATTMAYNLTMATGSTTNSTNLLW